MAELTEVFAVTETVSTTEHSFTTDTAGPDAQTTAGKFKGLFDVSTLAAGDEFKLQVYEKVNAAGTQRVIHQATLIGAQGIPIYETPFFALMHGWDFTWDKIAGTDRSIVGSIRQDTQAATTDIAAILVDTAEIGVAGAGLTAINLPNQTMDITGNITGNLSGSVGSVTGAVGSVTGAVGSITGVTFPTNFGALVITAGGIVDSDIETINGVTIVGDGSATPFNV